MDDVYYTLGTHNCRWYDKKTDPQHCFRTLEKAAEELEFLKTQDGFEKLNTIWIVRTETTERPVHTFKK